MSKSSLPVLDHSNIRTRRRKRKNRQLAIIAGLTALLLIISSVFSVYFYLSLQKQLKLNTQQTQQIASLQETIQTQEKRLQEQQDKLNEQQDKLNEQQNTLDAQQEIIKQQQEAIKKLQDSITILQNNQKDPTVNHPTAGIANFPKVDVAALAGKKLVALTFDDGPGPHTARLLDALKARGARATFFVLGSRITKSYEPLIKRMETEGHVVGNHSHNHKNLQNLSAAQIKTEMDTAANRIKDVIGHNPYVMRCPGGNYNDKVLAYAKTKEIPIIGWSVDTLDWKYRDKASILKHANDGIKHGSIVLMHDLYSTTVDATIALIDQLKKQGYTFVTVPELLTVKYGLVEAGKVYSHS